MKGFFVGMAILVGTLILIFTNLDNISEKYLAEIAEQEGGIKGKEAFDKLRTDDLAQFQAKYEEPFRSRLRIASIIYYIGDYKSFRNLAEETHARYAAPAFDGDEDYASLLGHLIHNYEDKENNWEALAICKEIAERFPKCAAREDSEKQWKLLRLRMNLGSLRPSTFSC